MAKRKQTPDWQQYNDKILSALDLRREFEALGIDVTGREEKSDGWLEVRAIGRDDANPSAAVNLQSGRYRDLGGEGLSLSLWDVAVQLKRFSKWTDARDHYATKAGIESPKEPLRDPAIHLEFLPWNDGLAALWCRHKPGISVESLRPNGARLARYREQYTTICLPIFGERFTSADPVGYVLYNVTGAPLPIFHGRDKKTGKAAPPTWAKMKTTGASEGGLLGQHAIDRLTAADADPARQLIWKVEGPSDLLALWSIIPPEKRDRHLVVTNSGGAQQNPLPWMVSLFAGRHVVVLGDADKPGVAGAAKWATWAAKVAQDVCVVSAEQLGYEVAESHGRDLRDWTTVPHTYADLLELADAAEVVVDQQQPNIAAGGHTGNSPDNSPVESVGSSDGPPAASLEADDDPHRLARVNLDRYATRTDGRTLAYWRDEWYVWKRNAYHKISERELRAKLSAVIKDEFNRVALEAQAMADAGGRDQGEPIKSQKVTMALISNVLQATSGMTCISSDLEPNTWLPARQPRGYVSMANGLVDVDAILADRDDYLQPNTPKWFSMVSLPYAFDPEAACPRWDAFLEHNLELDPERIKLVQEWAGYLLTASTNEQRFMILEGEGKNGKSVFIAGLTAMLGLKNVANVALENFGDRFQLTNTVGKLLNASGDCGELDKTAEGLIKSFVAGDRMYFDRKGLSGFNATPTARLMIACNNRPRFGDRSDGIWRRMLVVPWRVEIDEGRRVKGMDKVAWWQASGELPGIFRWALVGLARLRAQGCFTESSVMQETLREYKEEMNPARSFLQEYIEESMSGLIRSSELFRLYKKWIDENGYRSLSERVFGKEVARVFKKSKKVRRGGQSDRYWAYEGIEFSQDDVCGESTADLRLF